MNMSRLTLVFLILVIAVLLATNFSMYQKSKSMIKVIKQLNAVIEKQGSQITKLAK